MRYRQNRYLHKAQSGRATTKGNLLAKVNETFQRILRQLPAKAIFVVIATGVMFLALRPMAALEIIIVLVGSLMVMRLFRLMEGV